MAESLLWRNPYCGGIPTVAESLHCGCAGSVVALNAVAVTAVAPSVVVTRVIFF